MSCGTHSGGTGAGRLVSWLSKNLPPFGKDEFAERWESAESEGLAVADDHAPPAAAAASEAQAEAAGSGISQL